MNRTTILSIAIALASLGGAIAMRPKVVEPKPYEDTGMDLFPDFKDYTLATSLEVIGWDEEQAQPTRFKVEQKGGQWVIPSHNDYPADATERMGKAAVSFIDVKRDKVQSDRVEDQEKFEVGDPSEKDAKGKGQRVTIKDEGGKILVDIILGKTANQRPGFRYVRFPGEKRIYEVKIDVDISTDFVDWIEQDLLKLESDQVVALMSDAYSVDEQLGQVKGTDPVLIEKAAESNDPGAKEWQLAEGFAGPKGKVVDESKVRQVINSLDRLQIVGVRPRPNPLTLLALQSKGFFVTPDGTRLFGNEGELRAICADGVVYTLYFGEVTFDSGLALTAGSTEQEAADSPTATETDTDHAKKANRYMFVDVAYDPSMDKTKTAVKTDGVDDTDGAEKVENEGKKLSEGEKRAQKLQKRFDQWFYVISDDSFKQMHKTKTDFFKDPPAEEPSDEG